MKKLIKSIVVVLVAIVLLTITYKVGYNSAIHDAVLVDTTTDEYFIEYRGQVHEYIR